jgi:protein O-GlcNAc transferase
LARLPSGGPAAVSALFRQAVNALRGGNLDAALHFAGQVLGLEPRHPGALQLLAEVWGRKGDPRRAAELLERVPKSARDWRVAANLGSALTQLGDLAGAERQFRLGLKDKPDLAILHFNLGNVLDKQGRKKEAAESYRRSLALDPGLVECRVNLADLLGELKAHDEAEALLRGAAELAPARAEIAVNLGHLLKAQGKRGEAESWFRRALELRPDLVPAQLELARLLADKRQVDEAEPWLQRAAGRAQDNPDVALAVGDLYRELERYAEAEPHLRAAVSARPDSRRALLKLALVLDKLGKYEESEQLQQQFLALAPVTAKDWEDRGRLFLERGEQEDAVNCYLRALRMDPSDANLHAALVFVQGYLPELSPAELFRAHVDWAQRHASRVSRLPVARPGRPAGGRLRLGYLSPDLREHSVAYFLAPVLAHHDHGAFEIFCYSTSRKTDDFTARLRRHADHWIEAHGLSDEELAQRIRDDGIDILVDLAGYTSGHRLLVLARKPAPLQLTWMGYSNTTGLKQVDYRITDALADPPGEADALHSEKLVRLPGGFCCYEPRQDAPEPGAVPCLANGHLSFGCFNNPDKINDRVIALWARILQELPESRLILKGTGLEIPARRRRLEEAFRTRGVDPACVELRLQNKTAAEHLGEYAQVDVALDTFPYNGVTTTCEALWMGVPVVALAGDRHAGRTGLTLLTHAGVPELVADSEEQYLEIALALARDPARLAGYRSGLRARLRASPLLDAGEFTRHLEAAFRELWREHRRDGGCALDTGEAPVEAASSLSAAAGTSGGGSPTPGQLPVRRLHIGGQVRAVGWEVLDANPGRDVDHVGNANDLSRFADATFAEIYASHVLEHLDYTGELARALRDWWRVLVPGGRLYVSVPDMDTLARLFLDKDALSAQDRFFVMRMMFGGHVDRYDYHVVGLNEEFLAKFLREAGFVSMRRVEDLGLFDDTSRLRFGGTPISLNMIATKPVSGTLSDGPESTRAV